MDYLAPVHGLIAEQQIGKPAFDDLGEMANWLYGPKCSLVFRVAPSIVTRSEAELLGVSNPRFALRAYLEEHGFVNARRLGQLANSVRSWGTRRMSDGSIHRLTDVEENLDFEDPQTLLKKQPCIADSLLRPPERLNSYHVLQVDLGIAYGEGSPLRGTPFLQHMRLGGGLCAQAVCQMAVTLCVEYAATIHGVAEITAITSEIEHNKEDDSGLEMDLGGMDPKAIENYLKDKTVGLNAMIELPISDSHGTGATIGDSKRLLSRALSDYLRSGFPVILPVDAGRMRDLSDVKTTNIASVFADQIQNLPPRLQNHKYSNPMRRRYHAVIAVGYERAKDDPIFVINDPATFPFLTASAEQIFWSRPYRQTGPLNSDNLTTPSMISVVPKPARLPLLTLAGQKFGLYWISDHVARNADAFELPYSRPLPEFSCDEFRLVNIEGQSIRPCEAAEKVESELVKQVESLVIENGIPDGWYWIERKGHVGRKDVSESVWIWNASALPLPHDKSNVHMRQLLREYLAAVSQKRSGVWECVWKSDRLNRRSLARESLESDSSTPYAEDLSVTLNPSLITSFSPHGVRYAAKFLQESNTKNVACELYAFMQPDIDLVLGRSQRGMKLTVVEAMAQACENSDQIKKCAGRVAEMFPVRELPIIGLASFIPEVTARRDSTKSEQARDALVFLLRFAAELVRIGKHPVSFIEIVGGSRIEAIFPGSRKDGDGETRDRLFAVRSADETAQERLVETLKSALRKTDKLEGRDMNGARLALEIEPGPLYTVRSRKTLIDLGDRLRNEGIHHRVGINFDTSHFRLAKIDFSRLPKKIRDRFVHMHISDNYPKAHFGDVRLFDCSDKLLFVNELNTFRYTIEQRKSSGSSSGYASLELEAAKTIALVRDSIDRLSALCKSGRRPQS